MEYTKWMFNASLEHKHVVLKETKAAQIFVKTTVTFMACVLSMHVER